MAGRTGHATMKTPLARPGVAVVVWGFAHERPQRPASPALLHRRRRPRPLPEPLDAPRRRLHGRGLREADRRDRLDLEHGHALQHAHRQAGASRPAAGADAAGGKAIIFGTITVSDGISMGTPGMRYSMVSREVIADSIETVAGAEGFDAVVAIGGCDKNMPGCLMALARLNRPVRLRLRGHDPARHPSRARRRNATSSRSSRRSASTPAGKLDDAGLNAVEACSIPGPGSVRRDVHGQHHGLAPSRPSA